MPGKDESRGKREFTAFLTVWGGQKARLHDDLSYWKGKKSRTYLCQFVLINRVESQVTLKFILKTILVTNNTEKIEQ